MAYVGTQQPRRRRGATPLQEVDAVQHHITLAANFITGAFLSPDGPVPEPAPFEFKRPMVFCSLKAFIANVLRCTKHPYSVVIFALFLLYRFKEKHPNGKSDTGSRMFLSAYMISAKMLVDETYSNKSYMKAAGEAFPLREVNQIERDFLKHVMYESVPQTIVFDVFEAHLTERYGRSPQEWVKLDWKAFGVEVRACPTPCSCTPQTVESGRTMGASSSTYPYPKQASSSYPYPVSVIASSTSRTPHPQSPPHQQHPNPRPYPYPQVQPPPMDPGSQRPKPTRSRTALPSEPRPSICTPYIPSAPMPTNTNGSLGTNVEYKFVYWEPNAGRHARSGKGEKTKSA